MYMKPFSANELMTIAIERTGLDNFGDPVHMVGFEKLIDAINSRSDLSLEKVGVLKDEILRLLTNRLRFHADLTSYPEIEEEEILPPVVIVALPRTGTTKLHRTLGALGDLQSMSWWQTRMFARIPELPDDGRASRLEETRNFYNWRVNVCPNIQKTHPMFPEAAEEELFLMDFTFRGPYFVQQHETPEYLEWASKQSVDELYDYLLLQIKYLQWQFYPGKGKPWLLKAPAHLGLEDQLTRIFPPGIKLIETHRSPIEIIASTCDTVHQYRQMYYDIEEDHVLGPAMLGPVILKEFAGLLDRHMEWRERNTEVEILDISFREVNNNMTDVIRRIYGVIGEDFNLQTEEKIKQWELDNPRDKHGKHEYTLEMFGLTAEQVQEAFKGYIDKFSRYF
jgi:hypothetical protein